MGNVFLILGWMGALFTVLIGGIYRYRYQSFGGSGSSSDSPSANNLPTNNFSTDNLTLLLQLARYTTFISTTSLLIATFSLGYSFLVNDYSLQYVWQYSNREMDAIYKFTAIWGGMDGSMLLWCLLLAISAGVVAFNANRYIAIFINGDKENNDNENQNKGKIDNNIYNNLDNKTISQLQLYTLSALATAILFFVSVTLFQTNPFRFIKAPFIPPDGNGLNPLLQNPYMAIHPPMLYLGFTTFAVPYAFCLGGLLAGDAKGLWLRLARRWSLVAWAFLTVGIFLGGHWAYLELGWGGFWAWDPVENASFLPWLTGTAFIHSVIVQETKGALKGWNCWLIVLTYALTVFGTFLTRSGVVQSIHAFASTDIGWTFLLYLTFIIVSAAVLIRQNRVILKSDKEEPFSLLSREMAFLLNNLLFLSICFSIIWGVLFPVFSEYITGEKQTVGVPYFNAITVPMFLVLLLIMAVSPFIAWRSNPPARLVKTFAKPFCFSLFLAALLVFCGITKFYPILAYCLAFFVVTTILLEAYGSQKGEKKVASIAKRFGTKRFNGLIVHLGVAVVVVSITASMAHKTEAEFSLGIGESFESGKFRIELNELSEKQASNYFALVSTLSVYHRKTNELITTLTPELRRYAKNDMSTTEVALKMRPLEDIYLIIAGIDDTGTKAAFKLYINPLQVWLWVGAAIMVLGTGLVLGRKGVTKNS